MKRYHYKSYREYCNTQRAGYEKKMDRVWTQAKHIKIIAGLLGPVSLGLCHGVRTGKEVEWFRKYTGARVIGSEIGKTSLPDIVQWDFNRVRGGWVSKFDFVYSNSFDHAYNLPATLSVWFEQLRPGGVMLLEHGHGHEKLSKLDPVAIKRWQLKRIMRKCGLRNVREVVLHKFEDDTKRHRVVIIGEKPA